MIIEFSVKFNHVTVQIELLGEMYDHSVIIHNPNLHKRFFKRFDLLLYLISKSMITLNEFYKEVHFEDFSSDY